MELKKVNYADNIYFLNPNKYFYFNNEFVKTELDNLKFPIIMMDTEFFNKSHDPEKLDNPLYSTKKPDLVYTISFSKIKTYEDLLKRDNDKSIITYSVRRRFKDENFNYVEEMDHILTKFFNYAFKQKAKTLVFAGKANDEKILNLWFNEHQNLFTNRKNNLVSKDKSGNWKLNIVDIYPILEHGLSFHDDPTKEKKFQLKKGLIGEDTIQLPSLGKFYESINLFPKIKELKSEDNIYVLCVDVLKLYTIPNLTPNLYRKYQTSYRQAVKHCRNDVLKLIYLVYFLYVFANKSLENNPFIKNLS